MASFSNRLLFNIGILSRALTPQTVRRAQAAQARAYIDSIDISGVDKVPAIRYGSPAIAQAFGSNIGSSYALFADATFDSRAAVAQVWGNSSTTTLGDAPANALYAPTIVSESPVGSYDGSPLNMSGHGSNRDGSGSITGFAGSDAKVQIDLGEIRTFTHIILAAAEIVGFGDIYNQTNGCVPSYGDSSYTANALSNYGATFLPNGQLAIVVNSGSSVTGRYVQIAKPTFGQAAANRFEVLNLTAGHVPTAITVGSVYAGFPNPPTYSSLSDGNISTGFASDTSNRWIKYDLGSAKTVRAILLGGSTSLTGFGNTNGYANGVLEYSNDDSTWTTAIVTIESPQNADYLQFRDFLPVSARYWRLTGGGTWLAISEMILCDYASSEDDDIEHIPTAVSQSTIWSNPGTLATLTNIRNNVFTDGAGTGNAASEWLRVDLGESKSVNKVVVAGGNIPSWGNTALYANSANIQYSTDDVNWNTIATTAGATDTSPYIGVTTFAATSARYWRLQKSGYISTTEFRLYSK